MNMQSETSMVSKYTDITDTNPSQDDNVCVLFQHQLSICRSSVLLHLECSAWANQKKI